MRFVVSALAFLVLAPGVGMAQVPPSHGAVEGQLCRSQLELLADGGKLTEQEKQRFEAQCDCLEKRADAGSQAECTESK
jgi:hypothetical protein